MWSLKECYQATAERLGAGSHSRFGGGTGIEELSEAGAEFTIEDGAAKLEESNRNRGAIARSG